MATSISKGGAKPPAEGTMFARPFMSVVALL
jgi:hypothetical protein